MKILSPSFELLPPHGITQTEILQRIERCGRICYKSEDKITEDSCVKFVGGLISRGHEAVLEHATLIFLLDYHTWYVMQKQIAQMKMACLEAMDDLLKTGAGEVEFLSTVAQMEQKIDDMTDDFRRGQIKRRREGLCDQEACIIYSELLTDFERIGDHVLNIAEELTKAHASLVG